MGAARKLDVGQVCRGGFPQQPSGTVVSAFLKHVAHTGRPETFDRLSDTRPPEDGRLVVLTDFDAPRGKRGDGTMAPCPICSPTAPQFLSGVLIWCETTAAIYAIGVDCARNLWTDGRLDREIAAFRRRQADAALENVLLDRLPLVPRQRAWISQAMPAARKADSLARSFRKVLPTVHTALNEVAKTEGILIVHRPHGDDTVGNGPALETVGRLAGAAFVAGPSQVEKQLRICDETLRAADFGADDDAVLAAVCRMSDGERLKCSRYLQQAQAQMEKAAQRIAAAWDFLRPANLSKLHTWGADRYDRVSASGNGAKVWIDCRGKYWSADLQGLTVPPPVPAND